MGWGNYDNAANTPLWGAMTVNKSPNTANQTALFDNVTPNYWAVTLGDGSVRNTGKTVGLFGVDANESLSTHAQHTGWTLRTVGSGGRAGRVTHEVLVAMSTMNSDADGQVYANVAITLVTSGDASVLANATYYANVTSFTVTPSLVGNTSSTLTYQWQYLNGTTWASIPANTVPIRFSGATTATLQARPGTTANTGTNFRAIVTAADQGVTATSANVIITIT
jgi:hypothetical protein